MESLLHTVGFQRNPWLKHSPYPQNFSGRFLLPHSHVKIPLKPHGKYALKTSLSSSVSSSPPSSAASSVSSSSGHTEEDSWKTWICEGFAPDNNVLAHSYRGEEVRLNMHHRVLPLLCKGLLVLGLGFNFNTNALASTLKQPTDTSYIESYEGIKEPLIHVTSSSSAEHKEMTIDDASTPRDVSEEKSDSDLKENIFSDTSENTEPSGNADSEPKENELSDETLNPDALVMNDEMRRSLEKFQLSDGFWRGIPTPEGSYLYDLKQKLLERPDDALTLERLLHIVIKKKDMLRALTVLETLLEIQPNRVKWKFFKAQAHEFLGDVQKARMEYEQLLDIHPFSARFLQGLVTLLNKVGEGSQAVNLIQQRLEKAQTEKKSVEARNLGMLLGQFYIQLGKFENALQHFRTMIDEDPNDFRPYLCQGLAYTLMDQTDKAEENFKKYMELCRPESLEQSRLDGLMVDARVDRINNAIRRASMQASSKRKKEPKFMQQPGISRIYQENFEE